MKRLIPVCLLLAGCATPQEQAAQQEARRQAYVQNLQRQCGTLGFQPGTDQHRQCMLQLHQQNEANRAALGAAILSRPQPPVYQPIQPPVIQPRQPTTTNCYRVGNNVTCNTF